MAGDSIKATRIPSVKLFGKDVNLCRINVSFFKTANGADRLKMLLTS
jgi:hypothetical protein